MDSEILMAGDTAFLGMASRLNPLTLPDGMLQRAENLRLVRQGAETRKGASRMATGVATADAPLVLPVTLSGDQSVVSITRSGATATATVTAHGYTTGDTVNIAGAAQTEYNGDWVITVSSADVFTYTVSGTPATPATGTILANDGPILRTTYGGGVMAAGVFSDPALDDGREYIVLAGPAAAYLWRQGETLLTKTYPAGDTVEGTDTVTLIQAFNRLYLLREAARAGLYASQSITSITLAGTTATATKVAHGFTTGERIKIEGASAVAYNIEADITVSSADVFTFSVSHAPASPASPVTGTLTARKVKAPLYWDGVASGFVRTTGGSHASGASYNTMPSAGFGAYFNNQLVIPNRRDGLLVSDILDSDTYDPVLKSFRTNAGSNDYIVAVHPYAEGQLLVFCRKSIYLATIAIADDGLSIDPATSAIQLLTDEIGCVARRTIATAGQYVFFLSDAGVYRLDSRLDLKLRGDTRPLSEPVQDQMDEINPETADRACAVYFNNRYILAYPTALTNGEPSTINNTVLIYSMLNQAWESRDAYSLGADWLLISDYDSRRRLYAASEAGALYLLEEELEGDDQNSGSVQDVIPGRLLSRRYQFDPLGQKRFLKATANIVLPAGAAISAAAGIFDPDQSLTIGTLANATDGEEDYSFKTGIRQSGHSIELEITTTAGRPTVRQIVVQATSKGLPGSTARTER